ncbi:hypothetical protein [Sigmofec virus UA08Rod_5306]|uniref:Uncharacterized protein n=1 Tax=Sigmofec virus UA08Rod_5306 TaxID=2929417 RepID=A0A976N1X4_9VIRU|nr:hypothetical protein [Sigmofec virus UA08Rod_5306]
MYFIERELNGEKKILGGAKSRNCMEWASQLGTKEKGETFTILRATGEPVSRAIWEELAGCYRRATKKEMKELSEKWWMKYLGQQGIDKI